MDENAFCMGSIQPLRLILRAFATSAKNSTKPISGRRKAHCRFTENAGLVFDKDIDYLQKVKYWINIK